MLKEKGLIVIEQNATWNDGNNPGLGNFFEELAREFDGKAVFVRVMVDKLYGGFTKIVMEERLPAY